MASKNVAVPEAPGIYPMFPPMIISMCSSFLVSNVFVYGVTGRSRLAFMTSLVVIPATLALYLNEGTKDFEKWMGARNDKPQIKRYLGLPGNTRPQTASKYDWSKHEDFLMFMLNKSKNESESTSK
uniref:Uncharacterized protein n=1 Tax=Ditylenchus dipsaci TaxID=166011 RepID=A0A915ESI8_9BILA